MSDESRVETTTQEPQPHPRDKPVDDATKVFFSMMDNHFGRACSFLTLDEVVLILIRYISSIVSVQIKAHREHEEKGQRTEEPRIVIPGRFDKN